MKDHGDIVDELVEVLDSFEETSRFLQLDDSAVCTLKAASQLFAGLVKKHPESASHLSHTSACVHSSSFERAVIKLQEAELMITKPVLNKDEKKALSVFKQSDEDSSDDSAGSDGEDTMPFVTQTLGRPALKKQKVNLTGYRSVAHVSPTSVVCERLFSRTKAIMTPNRRCMDPSTLDSIIFLQMNRDLWNGHLVE